MIFSYNKICYNLKIKTQSINEKLNNKTKFGLILSIELNDLFFENWI